MNQKTTKLQAILEGDEATINSALEKADMIYTAVFEIGRQQISPGIFRVTLEITL
ncbi:hypothetical protein THF1C08_690002 [Vibrio jasicida]|uniref:Uncharacterized protein n=1 Tax=Vibrio jasicida TaxID=766224 RepID=A0AAU9QYP7_9VIBR|nr:hypothetical protein THF1C08_690002 [Vibrio jasicida]CAH1603553.1 hypothetical protein THF1A12_710002 [Vibrio jasicida]